MSSIINPYLLDLARQATGEKRAFVAPGMPPSGAGAPMDPAMAGGQGAPMDPAAMGMDPAAMPPMDPAAMGGMPPEAMGAPPSEAAAPPPAPAALTEDTVRNIIREELAAGGGEPKKLSPAEMMTAIGTKLDRLLSVLGIDSGPAPAAGEAAPAAAPAAPAAPADQGVKVGTAFGGQVTVQNQAAAMLMRRRVSQEEAA